MLLRRRCFQRRLQLLHMAAVRSVLLALGDRRGLRDCTAALCIPGPVVRHHSVAVRWRHEGGCGCGVLAQRRCVDVAAAEGRHPLGYVPARDADEPSAMPWGLAAPCLMIFEIITAFMPLQQRLAADPQDTQVNRRPCFADQRKDGMAIHEDTVEEHCSHRQI